jgi:hypothetical protein
MKYICINCGEDIFPKKRAEIGYRTCLWCGEDAAKAERESWCVVQEYQKGGYMFVTAEAAHTTVKQTNQKGVRT